MSGLRTIIYSHARLMLILLALSLAVKAVVPAGFMLSSGGERFLTVTICSDASGMPQQMQIALPPRGDADADHAAAAAKGQICAFAGLGDAALGGIDPVLLAGALAFVLAIGLAPLAPLQARVIAYLRPPLRAPPALI